MCDNLNVIVAQQGSRHRYKIPCMLQKHGILSRLYIDTSSCSLLGRLIGKRRLKGRIIPDEIPIDKVFSTDLTIFDELRNIIFPMQDKLSLYLRKNVTLGNYIRKHGLDNVDVLYNFNIGPQNALEFAKSKGVKVITDVFITPVNAEIMSSEYTGDAKETCLKEQRSYRDLYTRTFSLSDILLCPSEFVADGVRSCWPEHEKKIRICPYGSSIDYGGHVNKSVKGRYFWAGGDWVRKGLHYMAGAVDELKGKYPEMEFRVAGIIEPETMQMDRFRNITFLGKLNTQQLQSEFLSADAFVFPTISEGMAGAVIEAIAAGCPIITTKAAGVDAIEDGISGLIIPSSDSEAVAEAIERLYLDREVRNSISKETIRLAELYTDEAWGSRLIKLIKSM